MSFDKAFLEVKKLVEKFEKGQTHYLGLSYKEQEARQCLSPLKSAQNFQLSLVVDHRAGHLISQDMDLPRSCQG